MKTKSVLAGIVFFLLPCAVHAWTGDTWGSITRATIKSLADQMIDSTWTPNNTFNNYEYTENGVAVRYTYTKGVTYTGMPYGQAPTQDNWQEFSGYMPITIGGNKSYGNDCSGFVSICWKLPARNTTATFESGINGTYWSSLGNIGSAASVTLLPGDALNFHSSSAGHILMFLNYESSGFRSMEQNTPPHHATRLLRTYSSLGAYRPIRRNQITGDGQPDLTIVEPVVVSPASVAPGGTIRVDWTEKNKGTVASTQKHNTKIFLSGSAYGTTYLIGGPYSMNTLGAGATQSYYADNIVVPASFSPGDYYVTAFIDCDMLISETDNNNNIGSSTPNRITIITVDPSTINSVTFSPPSGSGKVPGSALGVEVWVNLTPSTTGYLQATITGGGMAQPITAGVSIPYTATGNRVVDLSITSQTVQTANYTVSVRFRPGANGPFQDVQPGDITATENYSVIWKYFSYTINVSAGSGGIVSPSGNVEVIANYDQTFIAYPSANYAVDQWLVDNSLVQNGGTVYTLNNVTANRSVQVTFKHGDYTVTPSAGANGSISPNTPQTVTSGGSVSFTASPNANYVVNQWLVDGSVVQTGVTGYTLSNIQANRSVQVTFAYDNGTLLSMDFGAEFNWLIPGLGSTVPVGASGYDVVASGFDIWNNYDAFRYVYQPISGDFDVQVQVTSLTGQDVWVKAGLMVREALEGSTRDYSILVTPAAGMNVSQVVMRRFRWWDTLELASQAAVPYPNAWLRIARKGNQLSAYTSSNGTAWSLMQQSNLALPNSVFVGMATTAHDYNSAGITAIASYRSFQVTSTPFTEPKKALKRQVYKDIPGGFITDLTGSPAFPNSPSTEDYVAEFESSMSLDNYGEKLTGYLIPPITGNYQFYLASDDASKIWLSTDESPANKQLIVEETGWNAPRNFEGQYGSNPPTRWDTGEAMPQRVSSSIYLQAGKYYYVEALHKQGNSTDPISVAWKTPGGTAPANGSEPISGDYLSPVYVSTPYTITASAGIGGTISPSGITTKNAGESQAFTASPNANYVVNQWLVDGSVVQAAGPSYTFSNIQVIHSVQVTFTYVSPQYQITASASTGGTISPSGTITKNAGESQAFTASPNANYVVNQWLVDGSVVPTGGTGYTLSNIQTNHSVQVTFTYVIGKATVTLGSLSHTFDGTVKNATVTTVPAGLTVTFTYNGSPSAPVNAGIYTVIGTVNDPTYQGSATSTLVIGKANATMVLGNLSQIYDGSAKTATFITTPPGLTVNFTYNGSPSAPINAGIYTVIGTVNDPNYQGSANNTLVISETPVTLTITMERGNNRITLGWPNGFKLQSSPVLPATNWQDVAESETTNSWSVTIGASNQFYRVVTASMALIPAGAFTMGDAFGDGNSSELPQHTVYVSAFSMDKTEVTKALWDEVKTWAAAHGYSFDNEGSGKAANHPVQTVSWYDVVKWCNARSQQEGRVPAYYTDAAQTMVYRTGQVGVDNSWVKWNSGYRLPTEAEWEKAARGGASGQRFPWSNVDTITHSQANYLSYWASGHPYYSYDENLTEGSHPSYANDAEPYTSPVGSFAANGYGLHDMAGNVNEWCWDWHGSYSSGTQADPRGPSQGSLRVFRGGNWGGVAFVCRVAYRISYNPDYVINGIGFRSVLPPGQ